MNVTTEDHQISQLSDLPQPKATPILGHFFHIDTEHMHTQLESWADMYGDTFCFKLLRHTVVATRDPGLVQFMLKSRPEHFSRFQKMRATLSECGIDGVFNAEGQAWKEQRALITESLKPQRLNQFMPKLNELIDRAIKQVDLLINNGNGIEPVAFFQRFSVNLITEYTFGYDVGSIEDDQSHMLSLLEPLFPILQRRLNTPVPYWRWFKLEPDKRFERSLEQLKVEIELIIESTRAKMQKAGTTLETASHFLETVLLLAEDENTPIDNHWLYGNILTLLLAGEDTTASTMAWMADFLAKDPELQTALYEEITEVLGDEHTIQSLKQLEQMTLLDACVQETLRLKSAAPVIFLESNKDTEYNGLNIPANTHFVLLTRGSALQESQYHNAHSFHPKRWLDKTKVSQNKKNMLAFGAGPRFCPGRYLSIIETKAIYARLIQHYHFAHEAKNPALKEIFGFTMFPNRYSIKLSPR